MMLMTMLILCCKEAHNGVVIVITHYFRSSNWIWTSMFLWTKEKNFIPENIPQSRIFCDRSELLKSDWSCLNISLVSRLDHEIFLNGNSLFVPMSFLSFLENDVISLRNYFFILSFFINYIYHSVWLGYELFGLRVQACSHWLQFTFARKGYDYHHCHNKPQTGNEAGVCMTSYPEVMSWEFGRFWKRFSWVPTMVLKSWGPTVILRSLCPTMMLRSWVRPWYWEVGVRPWCWEVGSDHGVEKLKTDHGVEGWHWTIGGRQLSSFPLRRRLSFSSPDQRRWIEI